MLAADMILHCGNHEKFNMEMIMALDADVAYPTYDAPEKDLYELGEIPPFGYVPKQMYAWAIRRERHGEPEKAFQVEVVDLSLIHI